MKYRRLTKEQFEELTQEFINFLASQSITAQEWETIKTEQPAVAEEELDVFSDLIWEGVLQKVNFLEHFSARRIYLFSFDVTEMHLIQIEVSREDINIETAEGYAWLQQNLADESVSLFTSSKTYGSDTNKDKFALLEQGMRITKGELFRYFDGMIDP